jgi:hypothetical protein
MLEELGIKDDYLGASKIFVRVELTPSDGVKSLMEPLDRWTLKVDQDVTPEWWDEKADRQRVEEAIETWRREHVFTEGGHTVETGAIYASGNATVAAFDGTTVKAYDNVTVEAYGNTEVEAFGNATVKAYNIVTVIACDSAKVYAYNNVIVKAYNNAKVSAYNSTRVKAWSRATVKAYDNAIAIYPAQNKAVYPIGWTIETHE